ncbi:putative sensor histidine kinase pdtaS [Methylorubrum podarium]|nr:putative sensor histidine kinase pdtaS [Methylorubrum podarium]
MTSSFTNRPSGIARSAGIVTNAIKYAYPDGQGEIRVEAMMREDGGLTVSVCDDGVGLPPGFDPLKARASLGMRVVGNLARQLDGTLSLRPGKGAQFELRMAPRH